MALLFLWVLILTIVCISMKGKISLLSRQITNLETKLQQPTQDTVVAPDIQTPEEQEPTPSDYAYQAQSESPNTQTEAPAPAKKAEAAARVAVKQEASQTEQKTQPGITDALAQFVKGGNIWVAAGVVFVVLSLSFAYRYISMHYHIPEELKVSGGLLLGFSMFILGWRKRGRRIFGQIMQGGGIGAIYLSLYAAAKLYNILAIELVFVLMAVLVLLAGVIALVENSQPLAFFAALLGFMAPLLLSTGSNNYIALFTFYTLLNIGILLCALKKYWRWLNGMAFAFTQIVWLVWLMDYYSNQLFIHTELYLVGFFLIFTAINIICSKRMVGIKTENVFAVATPFVFMVFQLYITDDYEYGQSIAAFSLGVFYLLLSGILYKKFRVALRQLFTLYLSFGIIFLNFAVPLALPGKWTAGIWACEGAMLVILGSIQNGRFFRWFGAILIFGATIAAHFFSQRYYFTWTFLNSTFLCHFLAACAMLAAAAAHYRMMVNAIDAKYRWLEGRIMSLLFITYGWLFWYYSLFHEASYQETLTHNYTVYFIIVSLSALIFTAGGRMLRWKLPQYTAYTPLLPMLAVLFFALLNAFPGVYDFRAYSLLYDPIYGLLSFSGGNWIAWLIFAAVNIHFLHHYTLKNQIISKYPATAAHACLLLLTAVVLGNNIEDGIARLFSSGEINVLYLHGACIILVMAAAVSFILSGKAAGIKALALYPSAYRLLGAGLLCAYTALWIVSMRGQFLQTADKTVMLPFFNSVDLPALPALAVVVFWFLWVKKHCTINKILSRIGVFATGGLVFFWLHTALGRTIYWLSERHGYPQYSFRWLYESAAYQLTVAILWGIVGFVLMLLGHKHHKRAYWLTGAAILACDAIKLLLVDLSNAGTLARIGSFMGVGLIMILIGYFIPLPPKEERPQKELTEKI